MKYFLIALLTAVIVFIGSYFYLKSTQSVTQAPNVATESLTNLPSGAPTPSPVSAVAVPVTTVNAGGILSMSKYSINLPTDWTSSKDGSVAGQSDTLTISKGLYKIVISQAAFGGGGCVYPGDVDTPMSQRFVSMSTVSDKSGDNFRVGTLATGGMAVCQQNGNSWGDITSFGHINVTVPVNADPNIPVQINTILSSLSKI